MLILSDRISDLKKKNSAQPPFMLLRHSEVKLSTDKYIN